MVILEANAATMVAALTTSSAHCPVCGQSSSRVHRYRNRTLSDVPWAGLSVMLRVRVRHFRCLSPLCPKKIFAERLGDIAQVYARRTDRASGKLSEIGLALGGEPGARLAVELGIFTSPDTILRAIRATPCPDGGNVRVLGVDEWAMKKGRTYGTILVDLERHCPIDLLPDRSSETLAGWLNAHPRVEIISRDRAEAYANGASEGAPDAVQVADRWHLLKNLREAAEKFCIRRHSELPGRMPHTTAITDETQAEASVAGTQPRQTSKDRQSQARRERRKARYDQVKELHQRGMGIRAISRAAGLNCQTVRKYVRSQEFPEISRRRPRGSVLDAYKTYLNRRWREGCHNGAKLLEEIRQMGYKGGRSVLAEYVTGLRGIVPSRVGVDPKANPRISAKEASWLLVSPVDDLSERQRNQLDGLLESCSESGLVRDLAQAFGQMVRQRRSGELRVWLEEADKSGIREFTEFAKGIRQDHRAVEAALSMEYSSGQAESQINRLNNVSWDGFDRHSLPSSRSG
ncbi:MAG: ISL3 family transposase [Chloroflexota bacterium]|nr:ISL3 family transposase [Chloroflexota bacterium]